MDRQAKRLMYCKQPCGIDRLENEAVAYGKPLVRRLEGKLVSVLADLVEMSKAVEAEGV